MSFIMWPLTPLVWLRHWQAAKCGVYVTFAVITPPALLCNINAHRHVITLSRLLCLATLFAHVQIIGARLLFPTSWRLMLSLVAVGWRQESWHPARTFPCGQFPRPWMTLKVTSVVQPPFQLPYFGKSHVRYDVCLSTKRTAHTTYTFKRIIETGGLLNITDRQPRTRYIGIGRIAAFNAPRVGRENEESRVRRLPSGNHATSCTWLQTINSNFSRNQTL